MVLAYNTKYNPPYNLISHAIESRTEQYVIILSIFTNFTNYEFYPNCGQ